MSQPRPNVTDPGRILAHRGASRVAPENTLAAFREAAAQGVHWCEFDVSLLGDCTPVVHHDGTLDRCTSGSGPLTAIGAPDLAGLDAGVAHSGVYPDEPLPTLDQVLDLLEELGLYANLEMKTHGGSTGVLAEVVAKALSARPWTAGRIIISSFDLQELAAFRVLMPEAAIAVLISDPPPDWRRRLEELDAAALHLNYRNLSQALLTEAVSFGFDVRVYTINEPAIVAPFRAFGLTGVITDHPPLFLEDRDWRAWGES